MRRALLIGAPLLAIVTLAAVMAFARRPDPEPAIRLSGPMPPLEGTLVGGGSLSRDRLDGKVLVVNFWASWCAPCRAEQPALERLWREYRDRGVRFVGVNSMDLERDALAYLREFGVTYPSVADPGAELMRRFEVAYLPATVLVGPGGEMRFRLPGERSERELRWYLDALTSEGVRG